MVLATEEQVLEDLLVEDLLETDLEAGVVVHITVHQSADFQGLLTPILFKLGQQPE